MDMLVFRPLLFLSVLILHVNCQGDPRHPHGWAPWSSWTRERECVSGTCVGNHTETTETVPETNCSPTEDSNCDPWSPWGPGSCPTDPTCDQERTKDCKEMCSNDKWSEWGSWTSCSHSCGGYKSRTRLCERGDCLVNNPGCVGESSMIVDCDHATEGILIATYNQAEMFIPSTKETFSLPAIPGSPRVWHTLTDCVLCGGVYPGTPKSCLELTQNGAGWQPYSTALNENRMAHSAWDSPSGIVLLGGYYSGDSSEIVTSTGSTSQFSLTYKIRYACAINDGAQVVVTGGFDAIHHCPMNNVSVYSLNGFEGNLPNLTERRQYHACARFTDQNGKNTYLVTGGFTGTENTKSTEIFTAGATSWTTVGDLNRARNGMRATTLDNMIYLLGGDTQILRFNNNNNTWSECAQMTEKAGIKLEISTIKCRKVHNYWPTIATQYQETTTSSTTKIPTTKTATKKPITTKEPTTTTTTMKPTITTTTKKPTITTTTTTKKPIPTKESTTTTTTKKPTTTTTTTTAPTTEIPTTTISAKEALRSAVSGAIYHIDSAIAQLDGIADKDSIMKLTFIKYILDNDLFGRRKKRWEQSCETELMTWNTCKSQFEDSLTILDSIDSTNPAVVNLVAELEAFFTAKITLINVEINSLNNCDMPIPATPEMPPTTTTTELSEETTTPTTTPRPPTKCPTGWTQYQGQCYRYYHERMHWQDARDFCKAQAEEADLASIHSEEENEFVAELSHNNWFWLGGKRPWKTCPYFVWSDESEWDYDHWLSGQPDNNRGNEGCVLVIGRNHKWNDAPCHFTRYVLCKQKCIV